MIQGRELWESYRSELTQHCVYCVPKAIYQQPCVPGTDEVPEIFPIAATTRRASRLSLSVCRLGQAVRITNYLL